QAHGLWLPGLRLLLPENQGRLPRESAMNHKKGASRPPREICPVLAMLSPLSSPAWLGSADPGAGAIR
ncbi:hypothetical protein ACPA2M_22125, partial [Ectopseudomonas chengduensis]